MQNSSINPPLPVPLPIPGIPFHLQNPLVLLAMILWGEARGEGEDGRTGVVWVVRNRVTHRVGFGHDYISVLTQPNAFSCLLCNDPNSSKLLTPTAAGGVFAAHVWADCYRVALSVFHGEVPDPTGGAVYYFSPPIKAPPRDWGPVALTVKIGRLSFYRALPTEAQPLAA